MSSKPGCFFIFGVVVGVLCTMIVLEVEWTAAWGVMSGHGELTTHDRYRGLVRDASRSWPLFPRQVPDVSVVSHEVSLRVLAAHGFEPRCIWDVGAYDGEWTRVARTIFPDASFICVDAQNSTGRQRRLRQHCDSVWVGRAISDRAEKSVTFFVPEEGQALYLGQGASLHKENTPFYANVPGTRIASITLTGLYKEQEAVAAAPNDGLKPDLIKIDVQGAELEVLRGAVGLLSSVTAVIVECRVAAYNSGVPPTLAPVVSFMAQHGFDPADISELHYMPNGIALEIDLLFLQRQSNFFPTDVDVQTIFKQKQEQ